MAVMEGNRTEERIAELEAKVDWGFESVVQRFREIDRRFEQVDKRFEAVDRRFEKVEGEIRDFRVEVNQRFDSLQRGVLMAVIALFSCTFTGFAGLIAAQVWA